MPETIDFVTGDELPIFEVTIKDQNTAAIGKTLNSADPDTWAPLDLTGKTVAALWRVAGSTDTPTSITGSVQTPATVGRVNVSMGSGGFSAAGRYEMEFQVTTTATSKIQTVPEKLLIDVRDATS